MFAVVVKFQIHPDHIERFMPLMRENATTSLEKEIGCLVFDVWCKNSEVLLYEVYESEQAFQKHLASDHFATFDMAVTTMVMSKEVHCYQGGAK